MRRFQVTPPPRRGTKAISLGSTAQKQGVLLGRLSEVGPTRLAYIDHSREHVVAVLGKRGSGKTHTLGVIIEGLGVRDQDTPLRIGPAHRGMLVFDTLNLFQWLAVPLASANGAVAEAQLRMARSWNLPDITVDARLWHLCGSDPVVPGSSPFTVQTSAMSAQDWGLLMDVDTATEPMGQLVAAAHDKVARAGWNSGRRKVGPVLEHSIKDLTACIQQDTELLEQFNGDTRRAVCQRLAAYDRIGLFSQQGTRLTDMVAPGEVTVMLLARAPEDLRTLVVFLLIRSLLEQRSAASEVAKDELIRGTHSTRTALPKCWVIVDEAQNIIPSRTASAANRELTRFVREGRNYGLSMAISSQQPTAIDNKVMAQVDILIAHTLAARQDLDYVQSNLRTALPDSIRLGRRTLTLAEALRELEVGQCLASSLDASRTYFVEVRPRVTPHGGFEA